MPDPSRGLSLALLVLLAAGCSPAAVSGPEGEARYLADYVPTPMEVVDRMLELAEVGNEDVVYDLGSGDGRIPIRAARRFGARGVGVEIEPRLVWFSRRNAAREGVEHLVTFLHQDALAVDLTPATVVTLYLGREGNLLLRPILRRSLRPGARVVSHAFDMGDWVPDRVVRATTHRGEEAVLYLWVIRE
jgi:SAM-dependent methyltransferase